MSEKYYNNNANPGDKSRRGICTIDADFSLASSRITHRAHALLYGASLHRGVSNNKKKKENREEESTI